MAFLPRHTCGDGYREVTGRYNFGGMQNDLSGAKPLALRFESPEPMFLFFVSRFSCLLWLLSAN